MEKNEAPTIPPNLLMLDVIGMILIGIGLAKYFGGVDVLPAEVRFEDYGVVLILAGLALSLPAMLHLPGRIRTRQAGNEETGRRIRSRINTSRLTFDIWPQL
jgi:hypothetical protein